MAFCMGTPCDTEFNIMIILSTYFAIGILSCIVWIKYRKTSQLTDYTTIMNDHDAAARTAMWRVSTFWICC